MNEESGIMKYDFMTTDVARLEAYGIDSIRDSVLARCHKIENEMYTKIFGLLYPGKSIKWLLDHAEEINDTYEFVSTRSGGLNLVRFTIEYRVRDS